MNYYDLRSAVAHIVPRMTQLAPSTRRAEIVREKGRKKNYSQFNLRDGEWRAQERLLNTEEINSFLEISCRAAACPMPFNMDIWDGLVCIAEGQLVMTKNGYVPIQYIKKGDIVLSYNETTKETEWKQVIDISNTKRANMVEIMTECGNILYLTDDHPVFTKNRGWIKAGQLTENDELLEQ